MRGVKMTIQQLEYKGLNLMDVIGTVEIAIDSKVNTIHLFDTQQIVEPEYDFVTKSYILSEGFYKMAGILKGKPLFLGNKELSFEQWIEAHRWVFYCSKQTIKCYENGQMTIYSKQQFAQFESTKKYYSKYILRLK